MTFFNFQEDDTGNQQFQVSNKWWYFLAFTIPLTSVVFLIWIAWQKWRFRSQAEEDKKIREKGTI
jgi:membrane protein YdbS with pleckstrin-like domain